ncbi:hypothetical protein BO94DRAFT_526729 [Aspergillus sclerotioniger CBS 115572]|uniref:N-acetyltransferase domain-containing protein n=1 Tax=Aspergillus sclerotioniger CBS 115572 TaxID=1450535 RepID=A0A317V7H2_9EURO|nr:hypothetical protein BO94DRAFT_526729 [Aspergillus sclerotioniger CBS 115572]PWY70303.1 hypothetical protein BO94DRAFT_526729 [Aspergillus sclerotioniger CBS 115572]
MPSSSSPFIIRPATPSPTDLTFLLSTYDSSLPFLTSINNPHQWGSIPFSQRGDFPTDTLTELQSSEENRLTDTNTSTTNNLRIFIAEREYPSHPDDHIPLPPSTLRTTPNDKHFLPVGFVQVREDWVPGYVKAQTHLPIPEGGWVYLEVIITDSRVESELRQGAGRALIDWVREFTRNRGKGVVWVDSWGEVGEDWLGGYYEEQGFRAVGEWSHERVGKTPWVGMLMKMDV